MTNGKKAMIRTRLSFRLHRTAIALICVALLFILMQGAAWFSLSQQVARSSQVKDMADTLIRQVAAQLSPLMADSENNNAPIQAVLDQLTSGGRILDASVYAVDGSLIARAGENIKVRDRLAIERQNAGSYFNHQLVRNITDKEGPSGFVRLTLDTRVQTTEAARMDNTTNILRLMILLALVIGFVLSRIVRQNRPSHYQPAPLLLTVQPLVNEENNAETLEPNAAADGQTPESGKKITDDDPSSNSPSH
jgi:membrane protein